MSPYLWKKVLVISCVLAGAGVLACIAALFNLLVPKGSLVAFFLALVPLGLAIAGILVGFVKACEKCEDYLHGQKDRVLGMKIRNHSDLANPSDPRNSADGNRRPAALESLHVVTRRETSQYLLSLRGSLPAKPSTAKTQKPSTGDPPRSFATRVKPAYTGWHGQ